MYTLVTLSLMVTCVLAGDAYPAIFARQTVQLPCSASGEKNCGVGCIQPSWTCCPDQAGGCPPTQYCILGSNGRYGCCDNGDSCRGPGGAYTSGSTTIITELTSRFSSVSSSSTGSSVIDAPTATSAPSVESTSSSSVGSSVFDGPTATSAPSVESTSSTPVESSVFDGPTATSAPVFESASSTSIESKSIATPTTPTSPPAATPPVNVSLQSPDVSLPSTTNSVSAFSTGTFTASPSVYTGGAGDLAIADSHLYTLGGLVAAFFML